ncbi:9355_t:CDS:2, partial [Ambispora leptoticha]
GLDAIGRVWDLRTGRSAMTRAYLNGNSIPKSSKEIPLESLRKLLILFSERCEK